MKRFVGLLCLFTACARTDGDESVIDSFTSGTACSIDLDCGPGRHCGGDGLCAADCVAARDCGTGNTCSACGRCVPSGSRDDGCIAPVDRACTAEAECRTLGSEWSCDASHHCARTCKTDDSCSEFGRGFGCASSLCTRVCERDDQCFIHGYGWACVLPAGVDPIANADSDMPVRGTCTYDASRATFVNASATDPPALQLQGIWGFLLVSSVRTQGLPKIGGFVDTASIQYMIVRIDRDPASSAAVTIKEQWCSDELRNFDPDDYPIRSLFSVLLPDRNLSALRPITTRIEVVPSLVAGSTFDTLEQLDLRGAKLDHPLTDPLPTYKDLTHAWDQDHDGKPGLTAKVSGALSGDLYQSQRWRATLHGIVVDRDHLHGLVSGPSDQTVLGASNPDLVNDSFSTEHPQKDRTYFRAVRVASDASCRDIAQLAAVDGSWLAYDPHFDPEKKP
ncbi:MAG: hypothetical protein ACXVEF_06095 [Polyangiales bacterium]